MIITNNSPILFFRFLISFSTALSNGLYFIKPRHPQDSSRQRKACQPSNFSNLSELLLVCDFLSLTDPHLGQTGVAITQNISLYGFTNLTVNSSSSARSCFSLINRINISSRLTIMRSYEPIATFPALLLSTNYSDGNHCRQKTTRGRVRARCLSPHISTIRVQKHYFP